ncbi:MAG TPA: fibronectin type III domain-containing protein [Methanomassiliicoccales archaeon]
MELNDLRIPRFLFVFVVIQLTLMAVLPVAMAAKPQVVPSEPYAVGASNWNGVAHIWWREPNQTGPGITHYLVYREINGTGTVLLSQLNDTDLEYNDRMPSWASTMTYWIVAENIIGLSNPSDNVTLVPNSFPSVPIGLRAVAGTDFVDLSWNAPISNAGNNITQYEVRRQSSSGDSTLFYVSVGLSDVPITSVHDDQAGTGTVYTYNVKALTNNSESGWSDSVTVTTPVKNINDNSGLLSVFAVVIAVIALQMAIVAVYVVVKRKAFRPKPPELP